MSGSHSQFNLDVGGANNFGPAFGAAVHKKLSSRPRRQLVTMVLSTPSPILESNPAAEKVAVIAMGWSSRYAR